jgi:hypothetical protein
VQRRILAIAALVSLLSAAAIWLWWPQWDVELAFFVRLGGVLLAAWLAYDDVQRLPNWLLITLPVAAIVLVRWPRLLLLLIPVLILLALFRRGASRS